MQYNYKNESLLTYLKTYECESTKRMKLARKIILYFLNHPEHTFEEATDIYLSQNLNKENGIMRELKTKKEVKNSIPIYLQSANLIFHGEPLINYLKEYCMNQFYDENELSACIRLFNTTYKS